MKIKKITITNFRGIDSLSLDFTDPTGKPLDLVVLAGPNGCGKTSVLEACEFACGIKKFRGEKVENSKNNVRLGNHQFEIEATFCQDGGNDFSQRIEGRREKDTTALTYYPPSYLHMLNFPFEYFSSRRAPELLGSVPGRFITGPTLIVAEPYRLDLIKRNLIGFSMKTKSGNLGNIPGKENNPFGKINQGWKMFYPGENQEFTVEPVGAIGEGRSDIFFNDGSGNKLPVDSLSSGELEVFIMLGWFATRDLSKGIILIDEPELHLHSAWHRAIMRALRAVLPATQIICATHSLEILDSVYSYERFTLLPESDPRIRLAKTSGKKD